MKKEKSPTISPTTNQTASPTTSPTAAEIQPKQQASSIDLEKKLDDIKEAYDEQKSDEKVKRKYTKRSAAPVKEVDEQKAESFAQMSCLSAHVLLNVLVTRMPKGSPLSDYEAAAFDTAFTAWAKENFDLLQKYGSVTNLLITTTAVILPRLDYSRFTKKKDEPRREPANKNRVDIREDREREVNIDKEQNS